jgi:RNA polymerase sigma factor (TIGR02999 family)
MSDVTRILGEIEAGDPLAASQLLPLIYDELRKLAAQKMAGERQDHTLQATALVHEAYLRLVGAENAEGWSNRGHFFAAAAEAMRRILVDYARSKSAIKRGGDAQQVEFSETVEQNLVEQNFAEQPDQILDLDDALRKLEQEDPLIAELVRLRLYAGLSVQDASNVLGISRSSAYEYWDYALSWFSVELSP